MSEIFVNTDVASANNSLRCWMIVRPPKTNQEKDLCCGILWSNLRYERKNQNRISVVKMLRSAIRKMF
jgi:hypothetical protein